VAALSRANRGVSCAFLFLICRVKSHWFKLLFCCSCHVSVPVTPMVTLPSTSVTTSVENIQQRLLVQLAQQSSTHPGAARPAISVIQLRPGSTTAPPTTLAFPSPLTIRSGQSPLTIRSGQSPLTLRSGQSPLTIRSGQPLTLVAAPTTSGVRLNQVLVSLYRIVVEKRRLGSFYVLLLVTHFVTITYYSDWHKLLIPVMVISHLKL